MGRSSASVGRSVPQRYRLTGTFFCVMTTAVSFPLIATAVCPDPEMALKAYSARPGLSNVLRASTGLLLTYLVQPPLGREDGEITTGSTSTAAGCGITINAPIVGSARHGGRGMRMRRRGADGEDAQVNATRVSRSHLGLLDLDARVTPVTW